MTKNLNCLNIFLNNNNITIIIIIQKCSGNDDNNFELAMGDCYGYAIITEINQIGIDIK